MTPPWTPVAATGVGSMPGTSVARGDPHRRRRAARLPARRRAPGPRARAPTSSAAPAACWPRCPRAWGWRRLPTAGASPRDWAARCAGPCPSSARTSTRSRSPPSGYAGPVKVPGRRPVDAGGGHRAHVGRACAARSRRRVGHRAGPRRGRRRPGRGPAPPAAVGVGRRRAARRAGPARRARRPRRHRERAVVLPGRRPPDGRAGARARARTRGRRRGRRRACTAALRSRRCTLLRSAGAAVRQPRPGAGRGRARRGPRARVRGGHRHPGRRRALDGCRAAWATLLPVQRCVPCCTGSAWRTTAGSRRWP